VSEDGEQASVHLAKYSGYCGTVFYGGALDSIFGLGLASGHPLGVMAFSESTV
jgi:hypothetical protein